MKMKIPGKVLNALPAKYNIKWLPVFLYTTIACYALVPIVGLLLFNGLENDIYYFTTFVTILIANFVICIFGFVNLKYVFLISEVGMFISTLIMAAALAEDKHGWEAFAATMIFVLIITIAFLIGITVQVIKHFINKKRNTKPTCKK